MSCFSKSAALMMQVDGVCRAGLILNAEGRNVFGRKDHRVREIVCSRDVKLHRQLFVVYNAQRRPVETRIDMIELEVGNRHRLTKVIHRIHHFIDIKYSPGRERLVIRFHHSLRWNADEYVVLIYNGREVWMQGKAKWQRTSTLIVDLVSNR